MNTTQRDPILTLVVMLFITLALAAIVLVALGNGMLWSLIGGVLAIGTILIGLTAVGVALVRVASDPVVKIISARIDMQHEANRHDEEYLKRGYVPIGAGYEPLQLPEPPEDLSVSLRGVTAEQLAEFKVHAVNLLALSKQEMGEESQQVLPSYRATENDYFKDGTSWTNAVQYLIANNIAYEKYKRAFAARRCAGEYHRLDQRRRERGEMCAAIWRRGDSPYRTAVAGSGISP